MSIHVAKIQLPHLFYIVTVRDLGGSIDIRHGIFHVYGSSWPVLHVNAFYTMYVYTVMHLQPPFMAGGVEFHPQWYFLSVGLNYRVARKECNLPQLR